MLEKVIIDARSAATVKKPQDVSTSDSGSISLTGSLSSGDDQAKHTVCIANAPASEDGWSLSQTPFSFDQGEDLIDYFQNDPWLSPDHNHVDITSDSSNMEYMWSPLKETNSEMQGLFYSNPDTPSTDPTSCIDPTLDNCWGLDQEKLSPLELVSSGDTTTKRLTRRNRRAAKTCAVS